jgi:biopolymer transport protein ExbD
MTTTNDTPAPRAPAEPLSQRARDRKLYAKLIRRLPEPEEVTFLNITPMMDLMTILLVFFIKNFSVAVTSVNPSASLALPDSTTQMEPRAGVSITITTDGILVENQPVVPLRNWRVDPSMKRDGEWGYLINPLFAQLELHHQRLKRLEELSKGAQPFRGEITVVCDKRTPYRLLQEVLYSAGQAEFNKYRLLVSRKDKAAG